MVYIKKELRKVICKGCGDYFLTSIHNKLYCNIPCYREYHNRTSGIKERKVVFKECKKEFKTNYSKQIFCSNECKRFFSNREAIINNEKFSYRFKILRRDYFKCIYCGRSSIEDGVKLHIDHIKPKSKGGTDLISNLVTSCSKCNESKSDLVDEELILRVTNIVKERNKQL